MSAEKILEAVLDLKGDVGEVKARIIALEGWLTAHVAEDQRAHDRLKALELDKAERRGKLSVWHAVSGAGGALLMVGVNYVLKVFHP